MVFNTKADLQIIFYYHTIFKISTYFLNFTGVTMQIIESHNRMQ